MHKTCSFGGQKLMLLFISYWQSLFTHQKETGADFTKGLSPVSGSNLRLLSQIIGIFYLSPWAQPYWISQKVSVSALAEPLAQILRLVESGLKFCKQRLKYGRHNSFFISKFEMAENRVQVYKTTP